MFPSKSKFTETFYDCKPFFPPFSLSLFLKTFRPYQVKTLTFLFLYTSFTHVNQYIGINMSKNIHIIYSNDKDYDLTFFI